MSRQTTKLIRGWYLPSELLQKFYGDLESHDENAVHLSLLISRILFKKLFDDKIV